MLRLLAEIITIVFPVFLVVALGYAIRRTSLLNDDFLFQLNRLVYYIALPLLLFYKIASADFSRSFDIVLVGGVAIAVAAGFALTYIFAVWKNYGDTIRGTFCQCASRGNLAYVGLAIVFNAYGESGLATAGVLLGFIVPLLNFFSLIFLLLPHRENRLNPITFLQQILLNPLIVACFIGTAWSYFQIPIPEVFDRALHIVTGMALPLALISIGASFSMRKLRGDLRIAFWAVGFKLGIMPAMTAVLLFLLGITGENLAVGVLFAGTPTATAAYIFSQQMRGDAELAGAIIMLTTLLSVFTYTVLLLALSLHFS